jgi:hypothetical protein
LGHSGLNYEKSIEEEIMEDLTKLSLHCVINRVARAIIKGLYTQDMGDAVIVALQQMRGKNCPDTAEMQEYVREVIKSRAVSNAPFVLLPASLKVREHIKERKGITSCFVCRLIFLLEFARSKLCDESEAQTYRVIFARKLIEEGLI